MATPYGVAVGGDGALYIGSWDNLRVRRVGPDGVITVAGNAPASPVTLVQRHPRG
ncbi:MAG: hypothetical protein IPK19_27165 [Chloroflexi bacterium]|nr:hypothetical protein [Chloroflexota bacterium]